MQCRSAAFLRGQDRAPGGREAAVATVVIMPKLGLTMTEGRVGKWLKQPGEPVRQGEPLLEVETEKITIEVEAPESGVLKHVLAREGAILPVAAPVAVVAAPDEEVDLSLVGSGIPVVAGPAPAQVAGSPGPASAPATPTGGVQVLATPAARKLAREHGIDLARVRGTGPGGRVTYEDVERAIAQREEVAAFPRGEPVTFYSDGLRLAGELFLPPGEAGAARLPGVVLCTGIQGLKELGMPLLAQVLADAGFAALTFDYRGFGGSEGARWRPLPHEQVRDVRAAITYLSQHPLVDGQRVGLLGLSLGGAHALVAAAEDERVRCVVALEPVTDGRRWLRSLRSEWEWRVFLEELAQDCAARVLKGNSRRVSIYEIMPPDPETRTILQEVGRQFPELDVHPEFPLESAEAFVEYRPEAVVDRIAPRPVLLLHGEVDVLVSPEESISAAARAGEPKRLVLLPGMGHLNWLNRQHPVFARVIAEVGGWFEQHLAAS
jgi:pimeloyl-ACP methyl ester carboxylesterase